VSHLQDLEAAVLSANNPASRLDAVASLGICLAQHGDISAARKILKEMQEGDTSGLSAVSVVRKLLLDGQIDYLENRDSRSMEKFRRAQMIAAAFKSSSLIAEVSATVAHTAFNFDLYEEFDSAILRALANMDSASDGVKGRICLTVADLAQFVGEHDQAKYWYGRSRILVRNIRDHSLMSAIEYNRLAIGLSRARIDRILENEGDARERRKWFIELASVEGLHIGLDSDSMGELILLCRCMAAELTGDYQAALDALVELRASGAACLSSLAPHVLDCEQAWLQACLPHELTIGACTIPSLDQISKLSLDDQLLALWFLRELDIKKAIDIDHARFENLYQVASENCLLSLENLSTTMKKIAVVTGWRGLE
jgi:hypothetical protein